MEKFTEVHMIIMCLVAGYGLVCGVRNTVIRVGSWLGFGNMLQSGIGQLSDMAFYSAIMYLVYVYIS